jgi:hypothetical protein
MDQEQRERILAAARAAVATREPVSDAARLKQLEAICEREHRENAPIVHKTFFNEPEPQPEPQQTYEQQPWWQWVDDRINFLVEQRVQDERRFILEVVGNALGELTAENAFKVDKSGLSADDARQLRLDLADARSEFTENLRMLREALAVSRNEPRPATRTVN